MTSKRTILYVAEDKPFPTTASEALTAEQYDLVRTVSMMQAIALLFLNRKIEAVLLEPAAADSKFFDTARILRSIRPDIPVILVAESQAKSSFADACVGKDPQELLAALHLTLDTARIA